MPDAASPTYQRLPGSGYRRIVPGWAILLLFFVIGIFALLLRGRRVRLWLGGEHLLAVESDGYREYYKRFRFQDIQSLTVRKTAEGKAVSGILGGIAAIFIAMGLAVWDPVGTTFLLIIGGVFGLFALINFLSGPTCECHLRTAVQTEELVSLRRLRHALKAIERLRPLIVEAQGQFTAEEIYAKTQETLAAAADLDAPPVIAAAPISNVKPPPRHYQSKVHFILFSLMVADLPVTMLHLAFPDSEIADVIGWGMFLLTVAFAIAAMVKQNNTDLPRILKRITWAAIGTLGFFFASALVYGFYLVFNAPDAIGAKRSFLDDPVTIVMTVLSTGISVFLGVAGFIHLRKFRAASNVPQDMTTPPAN